MIGGVGENMRDLWRMRMKFSADQLQVQPETKTIAP